MNPITATFTLERETKGTYRYAEDGDPAQHKIGLLYVKKGAISGGAPASIVLSVAAAA